MYFRLKKNDPKCNMKVQERTNSSRDDMLMDKNKRLLTMKSNNKYII